MSSEIESIINDLLNQEPDVFGVGVVSKEGNLITQTQNWDISQNLATINELLQTKLELGQKGMTSISLQGIKYMIVENTEERKIGTNITGKGHIIIAPVPVGGTGALICYINPRITPRDALFTVQTYAQKLQELI